MAALQSRAILARLANLPEVYFTDDVRATDGQTPDHCLTAFYIWMLPAWTNKQAAVVDHGSVRENVCNNSKNVKSHVFRF